MENSKNKKILDLIEKMNLTRENLQELKKSSGDEIELERTVKKIIVPKLNNTKPLYSLSDFVNFFKYHFSSGELSNKDLEKASGGSISGVGAVVLGLADTAASFGLASLPENTNKTAVNLKENLNFRKIDLNKEKKVQAKTFFNTKKNTKENENSKFFLGNCEFKEEPKFCISRKNVNDFENMDSKIFKIGNIEEERALLLRKNENSQESILKIKDEPVSLDGGYLPTGRANYLATVVLLENDVNVDFNEEKWEQMSQKGENKILIYKDSEAYKKLNSFVNKK